MTTKPEPESLPLFDGEEEPEFIVAPEVEEIAHRLLKSQEELSFLADEIEAGRVAVAYLFETKEFDPTKDTVKHNTLGKAHKAPGIWLTLSGYGAVIQIRRWFWDRLTVSQREALVMHELLHVLVSEGKVKLRPHDIEEFGAVLRRYGSYLPDRAEIYRQWSLWQREQDAPVE